MPKKEKRKINEESTIRKLSIVSVAGNVGLCLFKMFAGVSGNSGAMISDAVHSLSDVITTIIAYLGVKLSKRSADQNHPYGHERQECIASLLLGLVLLGTGLGIGKVGMESILAGNYDSLTVPGLIALVAAFVSIAVKEGMYWYTRHYARILDSAAFMADAWHHRSDALSSIGSMIGIGGAMLGFPVMDALASVVICIFVLKVAIDIIRDAIRKMLDTSAGDEYETELREFIEAQDGVEGIDDLRTRMFGNKVYVDLEIGVNAAKTFSEAHEIAETVHRNVELKDPNMKHIMIHVNPTDE